MLKYYIIIAHDGTEIIDMTAEAEDRIANMDYLEERYERECRNKSKQRKFTQNLLHKMACYCGLV